MYAVSDADSCRQRSSSSLAYSGFGTQEFSCSGGGEELAWHHKTDVLDALLKLSRPVDGGFCSFEALLWFSAGDLGDSISPICTSS